MRDIDSILHSIENVKLELPSKDYIEVQVGELEELYTYITELERDKALCHENMLALRTKLDFLNKVAEGLKRPKRLDSYA
jgi:hypothetical protein